MRYDLCSAGCGRNFASSNIWGKFIYVTLQPAKRWHVWLSAHPKHCVCLSVSTCACCTWYFQNPTCWGQKWLAFSSVTHRCSNVFTVFFLTGFRGWLTFQLNTLTSHFPHVCYNTFLSPFDPGSPWIFDAKLKHYKPRDKFCSGCYPCSP